MTAMVLLLAACLPSGAPASTDAPMEEGVLAETLALFPLIEGTTWVYEHQAYDADVEVTWRVVESVVQTLTSGEEALFYWAEIERTASVTAGEPFPGFITAPNPGTFWYLVTEGDVYSMAYAPEIDPSEGWLDVRLPLTEAGEGWYPDAEQRRQFGPDDLRLPGFRYVQDPFEKRLPMGESYDCFELLTPYNNGGILQEFCHGVGFTYAKFDHAGTPFGYEIRLTGFSGP